ncbi:MAG: DUF6263 family protein [Flavobacteriales bacterium AspAUS03]
MRRNFTVELKKQGTILGVNKFNKIYQEIYTQLKKQLPLQNLKGLILMIKRSFSNKGFKKFMNKSG